MITDKYGTELRVGDWVVYKRVYNYSSSIELGEVKMLTLKSAHVRGQWRHLSDVIWMPNSGLPNGPREE